MDRKQHKKIWTDVNQILDLIFSDKSNKLEGETDEDLLDDEIESSDEYDDASDTEEVEKDNKLGKGEVDVNMEEDFVTCNFKSHNNNNLPTHNNNNS